MSGGPNLAYFSRSMSLKDMVGHIYGKINMLNSEPRPNMFIQELKMYMDHFRKEAAKCCIKPSEKQIAHFNEFKKNLLDGIEYYFQLFPKMVEESDEYRKNAIKELQNSKAKIEEFISQNIQLLIPLPQN